MADAEETKTVRRVSFATLALAVIYILHFIVHVAHHGHVGHALVHLLAAIFLPVFGYYAILRRSTAAVYGFHMMNVIAAVGHLALMIVMVALLVSLSFDDKGVACSSLVAPAHICPEPYHEVVPQGSFSAERRVW